MPPILPQCSYGHGYLWMGFFCEFLKAAGVQQLVSGVDNNIKSNGLEDNLIHLMIKT